MVDLLLVWMLVLGPLALLAWGIERLFGRHLGSRSQPGEPFRSSEESETIAALRAQISSLKAAGREVIRQREQLRKELEHARAVVGALRRELESLRPSGTGAAPPDTAEDRGKFRRAKRAFAERFHPDRAMGGTMDRLIREQVFKEFWAELEKIERGR
jgi:hypothetical protein